MSWLIVRIHERDPNEKGLGAIIAEFKLGGVKLGEVTTGQVNDLVGKDGWRVEHPIGAVANETPFSAICYTSQREDGVGRSGSSLWTFRAFQNVPATPMGWDEKKEALRKDASQFPKRFRLRRFKGTFTIDAERSFFDAEEDMLLLVRVCPDGEDPEDPTSWMDFSESLSSEIQANLIKIPVPFRFRDSDAMAEGVEDDIREDGPERRKDCERSDVVARVVSELVMAQVDMNMLTDGDIDELCECLISKVRSES